MLTYADLQRIQRNERASPSLQKIDDNLFSDFNKAFYNIEPEYRKHFRVLMDDILERRKNKILLRLMDSKPSPPENITRHEKQFYEELLNLIQGYKKIAAEPLESADKKPEKEKASEKEGNKIKVRFLSAFPAIVCVDSNRYGPFAENDLAELPSENAKVLIERGVVEEA